LKKYSNNIWFVFVFGCIFAAAYKDM